MGEPGSDSWAGQTNAIRKELKIHEDGVKERVKIRKMYAYYGRGSSDGKMFNIKFVSSVFCGCSFRCKLCSLNVSGLHLWCKLCTLNFSDLQFLQLKWRTEKFKVQSLHLEWRLETFKVCRVCS